MIESNLVSNYKTVIDVAHKFIALSIDKNSQEYTLKAINTLERLLCNIDITDYLLLDANPIVPRDVYIECYFNLGTLYKNLTETNIKSQISKHDTDMFYKSISCFQTVLRVTFYHDFSIKQIVSIYTQLCVHNQTDMQTCLKYLKEALFYAPDNETIHYNLGFVYQKLNMLELSIIHYKTCISFALKEKRTEELTKLLLNSYNGLACIYRGIKQWPEALHFLRKAEEVDSLDPDIQSQLGVVYTEMRRTDLAEKAYLAGISNYKRTFISKDPTFLLAELHLNLGHMHSYNGDNVLAIENYNKALKIFPSFSLPFQNKLMNLSYLWDELDDKMYILNQHKLVNKLYKKGCHTFNASFYECEKINIGIVSGDFIDHPVSYFISTFLKLFDPTKYTLTCYSECIINTSIFNDNIRLKIIKNMSAEQASTLIFNDNIHILIDLAGHTALNRLDVFALKPSPCQVTYIGYPYSTGLYEMDYRITDNICDNKKVSQDFYTEKLLFMNGCFLCYDPNIDAPKLDIQPFCTNNFITFGCFNRLNKISDKIIKLINTILLTVSNSKFVFKTKALLNKTIQNTFLSKFDKQVQDRIIVVDCTILHNTHLLEYNKIDIAIDTAPYSGTTTSCEALYMGVPVFTLYDKEHYFHPTNVTCSILKNSDLDFYVCENTQGMIDKISLLQNKPMSFWQSLKQNTRTQFLTGTVCNKNLYMENFTRLIDDMYAQAAQAKEQIE